MSKAEEIAYCYGLTTRGYYIREDALDAINAALEWASQQAEKEPIECVSVPIAEAIRAGKSVPR